MDEYIAKILKNITSFEKERAATFLNWLDFATNEEMSKLYSFLDRPKEE